MSVDGRGGLFAAAAYLDADRPREALKIVSAYLASNPDDVPALLIASGALGAEGAALQSLERLESSADSVGKSI